MVNWFEEVSATRTGNGLGGVGSITYTELDAWARWTGRQPSKFEVRCIFILDSEFKKAAARAAAKKRPT